jgi:hypothetical protein
MMWTVGKREVMTESLAGNSCTGCYPEFFSFFQFGQGKSGKEFPGAVRYGSIRV